MQWSISQLLESIIQAELQQHFFNYETSNKVYYTIRVLLMWVFKEKSSQSCKSTQQLIIQHCLLQNTSVDFIIQ